MENWSGKDAVTQTVTLAQIMVDPYYRTLTGFCTLIEKEWMTFGIIFSFGLRPLLPLPYHSIVHFYIAHDFGQAEPKKFTPEGVSVPWLQFVHCLSGIWDLVPFAFEFNHSFLLWLMDSLYSSRFGTFLSLRYFS